MARRHNQSPKAPRKLEQRVKAFQARIRQHNVSAALINNPADIRYLTGFIGDDSCALIGARSSTVTVLSDFRYEQQIKIEAPHVSAVMREDSFGAELAKIARQRRIKKIALQTTHATLAFRQGLAKELGAQRLAAMDDGLLKQRALKDQTEIRLIEQAAAIQQEAFRQVIDHIKPGQTENQVCARLEYEMRRLGADGPSFRTIIAADANASLPHAVPGQRKIRAGGIVLIDWGARFNGYCADLTRVIAFGKMPRRIKEIYQIVLDAQLAAIEAIAPGRRVDEIDKVARTIITNAGYGDQFGHGLGHGIGLDIHEQPVLSYRVKDKMMLEPGHVVTVEPGIYLPSLGGVRIEDDVLVTARGRRVLTNLPKTLESAII